MAQLAASALAMHAGYPKHSGLTAPKALVSAISPTPHIFQKTQTRPSSVVGCLTKATGGAIPWATRLGRGKAVQSVQGNHAGSGQRVVESAASASGNEAGKI